jgi:hypothetical protein
MHTPGAENLQRRPGDLLGWRLDQARRDGAARKLQHRFYVMARKALESTVRDKGDLVALLDAARQPHSEKAATAATVVHAA